jgi:Tol biopolymer transport system component
MIIVEQGFGWDDEVTHKALAGYAADSSLLNASNGELFQKIGLSNAFAEILLWNGHFCDDKTHKTNCRVKDWLRYGAEKEDAEQLLSIPPRLRSLNHFHDPISGQGLHDTFSGESTLEWAQNADRQSQEIEGDQSWATLRTLYYIALTQTSNSSRKAMLAQVFKGLGHQMHLLQDMAVPYHVRNDAHPSDAVFKRKPNGPLYFETWAKRNYLIVNALASDNKKTVFPTLSYDRYYTGDHPSGVAQSPVSQLWDANIYNGANPSAAVFQGLAEYTNANFFSEDTIFRPDDDPYHYFPYPRQSSTNLHVYVKNNLLPEIIYSEDKLPNHRIYLRKVADGDTDFPSLAVGYLAKYFVNEGSWSKKAAFYRTFFLDEKCHEAYAEKLVPRAVGYSAALLDYFFRGKLDIRKFHVTLEPGARIGGVEFEIKNDTHAMPGEAPDALGEGSLDLVYQYRLEGQSEPTFGHVPRIFYVNEAADPINSEYVTIKVPFPEALPGDARDFSFMAVFIGKLGAEADSVAVGAMPSLPSRLAYHYQPGDSPNLSDIFITFPDGTDDRAITDEAGPNPWFYDPAWSPDGKKLAFEKSIRSGNDFFRDLVVIDLTADAIYPDNVIMTFRYLDTDHFYLPYPVAGPSFSPDSQKIVAVAGWAGSLYWALIVIDAATGQWHYINNWEYWQSKDLSGSAPAWNPKDNSIAYYIYRQPDQSSNEMRLARDIYRIDANGGNAVALTNDGFWNTHPEWSPDGNWIVFVSDRDGKGILDIWLMDRNGKNLHKIRDCSANCYSPSFSPDGLKIAFSDHSNVYAVNLNGKNLTQITASGLRTASPRWSPALTAPSVDLSAEPMQIVSGDAVTLKWNSDLGLEGYLDPAIGQVELQGAMMLYPTQTTTYTYTVTGWGGIVSDSVTVEVVQP